MDERSQTAKALASSSGKEPPALLKRWEERRTSIHWPDRRCGDLWITGPCLDVEWAYGNLLDSRDINSHDISWGRGDAEQAVKNYAAGTLRNEPLWFDYTWQGDQAYKTGIYSKYKAEWVAWHQHYWNYYKESVGFCDWGYCQLNNGRTPTAEPTFLNAITGRNHSFNDGLEIGRRAWTLKRAIFVMQGRHKNMENFTGYHYRPGASYCGYSTTSAHTQRR